MFKNVVYTKYFLSSFVLIALFAFSYLENNKVTISKYKIKKAKLPKEFNNFKIIQISDLHSKVFSENNNSLVSKISSENPEIIVITGDLIDRRRYNAEKALNLIEKIKHIAPIYYVPGNHEGLSGNFQSLEKKLKNAGVIVLRNDISYIERNKEKIAILGIDDPAFNTKSYSKHYKDSTIIKNEICQINHKDYFRVLLSHRPEHFEVYVEQEIDVVFTGHAHGGQVILPLVGGLIAPNQGLFPRYYEGTHRKRKTTMVISRGLGNSLAPQRIFNKPELVSVTLICA